MPIETSMYSQTPTTKLDPSGSMSSAITNANGMLQNKLLQSQVPLSINNEQIKNAQNQLQLVSDHLTPLIGLGDKVSPQDVQRAAMQAVQNSGGAISPDHAQQFVQQITQNPAGIPAALQQFHQRTLQGLAQAQAIAGQQTTQSNGLGVQHLQSNVYTGAVRPSGGPASNIQVFPSRGEMAAPATVGFDQKSGAPIVGTNQQRLQTQGGSGLLAPAFRGPQGGAGGTPGSSAGAAPAATPGPVQEPLPSSVKGLQDDLGNSSAKMSGVQPLLQAIPLIQSLGASGAGPGSAVENQLKSFLVTHGVLNANDTNVDVRNEANKYLKKYVAASGASGASGSDYRTAFTSEANPNLDTDQKATLSLAKAAVAFDRMDAARPLAFGSDPNAKINEYGKHKATWAQSQDPRAYGLDLMDPPKRAALVQEMAKKKDTPEGQKFFRSLKIAHDNEMLTGPTNAGQ